MSKDLIMKNHKITEVDRILTKDMIAAIITFIVAEINKIITTVVIIMKQKTKITIAGLIKIESKNLILNKYNRIEMEVVLAIMIIEVIILQGVTAEIEKEKIPILAKEVQVVEGDHIINMKNQEELMIVLTIAKIKMNQRILAINITEVDTHIK